MYGGSVREEFTAFCAERACGLSRKCDYRHTLRQLGRGVQNEIVMAKQLISGHGRNAALHANETATSLQAMGDAEGAARWRRIRDAILDLMAPADGNRAD